MKRVAVFSLLLIFFAVTIIANNPLASVFDDMSAPEPLTDPETSPGDALRSSAPIPSPQTLLLIGSGLIGLIIYRKKFKDRK